MTQDTAAACIGVSNSAVSKWENGTTMPEIELLPVIADYYGVSIDELFGRNRKSSDVKSAIFDAFADLSCKDAALASYEISYQVITACIRRYLDEAEVQQRVPAPEHLMPEESTRSAVSTNNIFEISINSDNVNMNVTLLPNVNNFTWMDAEIAQYIPLFQFLADENSVKYVNLIHKDTFPDTFTADYIAEKAGMSLPNMQNILDKAVAIKLVHRETADLQEGTADLYRAYGDGMVLSILTLDYEYMCGLSHYECAYFGAPTKMIRGEESS